MKPATVSASLAVISTASKYLHNDLARAIKALEQKNQPAEGPFFDPRAKETCFKEGSEVAGLKLKLVPRGGSSFGPFLAPSLWQIC